MNDMPTWLQLLAVLCVLAIIVERNWRDLWRRYEDLRVRRNRARLAEAGLTPDGYMATINPTDYQSYAEAVMKFWPRRDRHSQRDSTLDRIGKSLGPSAAADVRALKDAADRLNGLR